MELLFGPLHAVSPLGVALAHGAGVQEPGVAVLRGPCLAISDLQGCGF